MGRTFRFKYRYIHMNDMYIYFHKTRLMLFYFGRKTTSCHRIWVHLVSQDTDQCQNYLLILRWCRLSPGSEKRQLWPFFHFPMVITASRGCNIRGGEVIVNLFFFCCRQQRMNLQRMFIFLTVATASSSVSPSCTVTYWKIRSTPRG